MEKIVLKMGMFVVVYLAIQLSILLHELGHAVAYKYVTGTNDWKIDVGKGSAIIATRHYNIRLLPVGGLCHCNYKKTPTPSEEILISIAGPLVTIGIFLLCVLVREKLNVSEEVSYILKIVEFCNGCSAILGLLPLKFQFKGGYLHKTDGCEILEELCLIWREHKEG